MKKILSIFLTLITLITLSSCGLLENENLGNSEGTNGIDGLDGTNGIDGLDGTNGIDGLDGTNGIDGEDGITPNIGENGNWWIGTQDTGVFAGYTTEISEKIYFSTLSAFYYFTIQNSLNIFDGREIVLNFQDFSDLIDKTTIELTNLDYTSMIMLRIRDRGLSSNEFNIYILFESEEESYNYIINKTDEKISLKIEFVDLIKKDGSGTYNSYYFIGTIID